MRRARSTRRPETPDRRLPGVQAPESVPVVDERGAPRAARVGRGRPRGARPSRASTSPTRTTAATSSCAISREWTRIGRSLAADVRFDDATVSRRHALIVNQADGVRVLDDRSLNGVYVNGEPGRVEPADRRRRDRRRPPPLYFLDTLAVTRPRGRRPAPRPSSAAPPGRAVSCRASMAETIAVLSLKGGTGKTTTVRTLADVLRRVGLDVLAIDLDPQGNLSDYFDVPPDASPDDRRRAVRRRQGEGGRPRRRSCPASPILAEVERSLSGKMGRELVLRKALKDARKQHDVILIDCPPALGLLTINGLVAADWALISSEAQYFALQGVEGALEVIEQAKEFYNPDLEWLGVVHEHRRHAHGPLARGLRAAEGALRRQGLRHRDPLLDRLRRVGRARPVDPRPPARPRRGLPRAGRRGPRPHRARGRPPRR